MVFKNKTLNFTKKLRLNINLYFFKKINSRKNQIERQIVSEISSRVESNKIPDLLDYKNAIQYTVKNEISINEDKLPSYAEIDKTHKFEKI